MISRLMLAAFALVSLSATTPLAAVPATLASVQSPRGAKVSFILIKPEKPAAAVILFAGGHGALNLKRWDPLESTCRHASLSIL